VAKGAWPLGDWPLLLVRIACAKCERAGQYHTASLVERYGPGMAMPNPRHELARCPRRTNRSDPCQVIHIDRLER
jgi:hypothetical protein